MTYILITDRFRRQLKKLKRHLTELNVVRDVQRFVLNGLTKGETYLTPEMFGLEIDLVAQPIGFTAYDVNLNVTEIDDTLILDCDYNTDVFDLSTIERFLGQFQTILSEITANPETHVTQLPLLTDTERHRILIEWNDTAQVCPLHMCLHQFFEEQVERAPDAEALSFEAQTLTYREFNGRANQVAHYLQTLGVEPDTLVGICMERSLEMLVGIYGILKAGGAYVPIDPNYPKERIAFMLDDASDSNLQPVDRKTVSAVGYRGTWSRRCV